MRIRAKLTLAFLTVALLPFSIASTAANYNVEQALTRDALVHLETMASLQKTRVERFLQRNYERFVFVAHNRPMRTALSESRFDPAQVDHSQVAGVLGEVTAADPAIENASLVDSHGRVLVSSDVSLHGAILHGIGRGSTLDPAVMVAYPMGWKIPQVTTSGILGDGRLGLAIRTRGEELAAALETDVAMGKTGESFLATRARNGDALFISPLKFDSGAALRRTVPKDALWVPITHALRR